MSDKSLFRRNLLIIAALHLLLIGGLFMSGFFSKHSQDVAWLDGGGSPATHTSSDTEPESTPEESTPAPEQTPDDTGTSAPSMITLGTPPPVTPPPTTPTPRPTPTPRTPTPTPSATPRRTPKLSPSPSPSSSPTPKKKHSPSPSPKSSPKKSASPKSSPKHSASPSDSVTPKPSTTEGEDNAQNDNGTATTSGTSNSKGSPGKHPGEGGGNRGGAGHLGGAEAANQITWYTDMIHDRFYGRWVQPVLQGNLTTIVKIRIEKDGRISDVTLAQSSGNAVMDDSVLTAAKSVTQVDPLPAAIKDSFYIVPIEFDLTPH